MPATGNNSYRPLSLSIRLRADGFSFFVCDLQSAALLRGEHFTLQPTTDEAGSHQPALAERLAEALARTEYCNRQIAQAYVLVDAPFTHVPLEHFRRDEAAAMHVLCIHDADERTMRVGYNILPMLEVAVLYGLPRDVEEAVLQFYPTARFFAAEAMLLECLAANAPMLATSADPAQRLPLFVHVAPAAADAAATVAVYHFADSQPPRDIASLRMANTFSCSTAADALYFVLNVWQSLGLDGSTDDLILLGHKSPMLDELRQSLSDYVLSVRHVAADELFPNLSLAREAEVPLELMALLLNRL